MFETIYDWNGEKMIPFYDTTKIVKDENIEMEEAFCTIETYVERIKPNVCFSQSYTEEQMNSDKRLVKFSLCFNEYIIRKVMKALRIH